MIVFSVILTALSMYCGLYALHSIRQKRKLCAAGALFSALLVLLTALVLFLLRN